MDFTFESHQIAFRDAIRKFLMVEAAPEMLREIWETTSGRSADLRARLADQGLTALSVPEDFGGIGLGDLDWVLVLQELGYYAIPESLVDTAYLAAGLLSELSGDIEIKREWLPRIASGEARVAIGHPSNPFVADAGTANLLLMWHNDAVHAVRPDAVKLTAQPSIDNSRRLSQVEWKPEASTRIADARIGAPLWQRLLLRGGLATAAQQVGLAQRMLDLGVDYAAQRKQFGKIIGTFQGVKHPLADVAVAIEFAEPVVHRAAYCIGRGHARAGHAVAQARMQASEAAHKAARASIQAHGAMGYTWEADLQMFMKRAWVLDAGWGDLAHHKARIAEDIFDDQAALGPSNTFSTHYGEAPAPRVSAVSR
ncbi:acyl-CoA dehydrogenase family protein [Algiphilus sp.]|uniref:acyl-CoA dehydrogenase family protein n=1 Tax=Algiphilus sp. TaxID=1872431 RepID=UPI001CA68C79|nr:acyl-CoA dehydrogenase family protein [Algiphilus sp.]MBY8966843.1 acyl-CoA/acyl-ACP dehydrogenase [Algiphilus acroporae]MCI5062849.1 acyl-CoA/acyl-ACP dehydrogenase [Algiphilus sp.]MCI5104967.1 acyl-CoA/acyl-ACP dehydrogenase [Algiphilus sp.]MCR9091443.1 acyl-CoA/acyl-ACP dehydrogenase [Pseudomonadota bacterium]